jgi:hypothetical protein
LKKKFWLSLLKRSPNSYILLQSLYPLPSGCALQSLDTVPFRSSINTHVFDALRHSAEKVWKRPVLFSLLKCQRECLV